MRLAIIAGVACAFIGAAAARAETFNLDFVASPFADDGPLTSFSGFISYDYDLATRPVVTGAAINALSLTIGGHTYAASDVAFSTQSINPYTPDVAGMLRIFAKVNGEQVSYHSDDFSICSTGRA